MTEICVQVFEDFQKIKQSLLENGFSFNESFKNFDCYFTNISQEKINDISYKTLIDNSIIVRNIVGDTFDIKNIVYKKKDLDENGNVISETKTKVEIDDANKAKQLFSNFGLNCWCDYINENHEFIKDEIIIYVQQVKNLGTFIEIEEFDSIKKHSDKEKFEILTQIVKSFGLQLGNDFSCKKPFMFLNK